MATTTLQEVYEKIRTYFSRPGAILAKGDTTHGSPACWYRSKDGDKCAVGCLISDEMYFALRDQSDFELDELGAIYGVKDALAHRLRNGENGNLRVLAGILGLDKTDGSFADERKFNFLQDAQRLHDHDAKSAEEFVTSLDTLARSYSLQVVAA